MAIPSNPIKPGTTISGKISWFGGPHDPSAGGTPASGIPITVPGIATYNQATLGGYWLVKAPNGRQAVVRQTDLGPAPFTGRSIDFTYSSLPQFGYSEQSFPTNAVASATYLGRTVPANYQHLAQGQNTAPSAPNLSGPTTQFDQAGFNAAKDRAIAGQFLASTSRSNPWNTGPKGQSLGGPSLVGPGLLTTKAPNPQDFTKVVQSAQNSLQALAGNKQLNIHPGSVPGYKGYVNPISGFNIGRTDMGVDASAAPGTPIRAIGDSKVVAIRPNWYNGQPYLQLQLLNGPKAGQYYYVAEQINPRVRPGQVVHAGDTIATYAGSGTGIEIGWGTSGWQTAAQASGNTGDASHGNSPAGIQFRQFLSSLGAR